MVTIVFVNSDGRVLQAVHCDTIMFSHVVQRKDVCDSFGVIPYGIWIVAKVSLLCELNASCIAAYPNGVRSIVNVGDEIKC
jgi:hypothetical protein